MNPLAIAAVAVGGYYLWQSGALSAPAAPPPAADNPLPGNPTPGAFNTGGNRPPPSNLVTDSSGRNPLDPDWNVPAAQPVSARGEGGTVILPWNPRGNSRVTMASPPDPVVCSFKAGTVIGAARTIQGGPYSGGQVINRQWTLRGPDGTVLADVNGQSPPLRVIVGPPPAQVGTFARTSWISLQPGALYTLTIACRDPDGGVSLLPGRNSDMFVDVTNTNPGA